MKKSLCGLVVAALAFQLTGCMALTGKRFGANVDDAVIATSIKTKYLFNNEVHAFWIDVDSHNGDVVLVGAVQDNEEEDIAVTLAKSVEGVRSVTSFLKIKDQQTEKVAVNGDVE